MERLIYISTARGEVTPQMVADILGRSRINNGRDGLTGLLIVGGRRFLQVLEGHTVLLDKAYARIKADARHFALVELERAVITERSFPDWEMGYMELGNGSEETLARLVERLTDGVQDASLRANLRGFAELHSRAA
jgi:hypothetical protein